MPKQPSAAQARRAAQEAQRRAEQGADIFIEADIPETPLTEREQLSKAVGELASTWGLKKKGTPS